jgi:hypothetical protein
MNWRTSRLQHVFVHSYFDLKVIFQGNIKFEINTQATINCVYSDDHLRSRHQHSKPTLSLRRFLSVAPWVSSEGLEMQSVQHL